MKYFKINIFSLFLAGFMAIMMAGCGGSDLSTSNDAPERVITSIQLTFADGSTDVSVPKGTDGHLVATAYYNYGPSEDITAAMQWNNDNTKAVEIGINGYVKAVKIGDATISGKYAGVVSNNVTVNVNSETMVSFRISPIGLNLPVGIEAKYTATGLYTDGSEHDITSEVSWDSNNTAVATFSGIESKYNEAIFKTITTGTTAITATAGPGLTQTTTLNVTAATLTDLKLSFEDGSISKEMPAGVDEKIRAEVIDSDGHGHDVSDQVVWTNDNGKVVELKNTNGEIYIKAIAAGTANISAKFENIQSTQPLVATVTTPKIIEVIISPKNLILPLDAYQPYTALAKLDNGVVFDITKSVVFKSDNLNIATVSGNTVKTLAEGKAIISAILSFGPGDELKAEATLEVTPTVTLTGLSLRFSDDNTTTATLPIGVSKPVIAEATYSNNTTLDVTKYVSWSVDNPGIVDFNKEESSIVAVKTGGVVVNAHYQGEDSSNALNITVGGNIVSISVTPQDISLPINYAFRYEARGFDANNVPYDLTKLVTWSSSDETVATIGKYGSGKTYNSTTGSTTDINATFYDGGANVKVSGGTTLTVDKAKEVTDFAIDPLSATIGVNHLLQLHAIANFNDGSTGIDITSNVDWSSANYKQVVITKTGLVFGLDETDAAGVEIGAVEPDTNTTADQNATIVVQ